MPNYISGATNAIDQYNPLTAFFGSAPDVINWNVMGLGQEQIDAIMQNIRAFPDITKLGNLYQQYMLQGLNAAGLPIQGLISAGAADTATELQQAQSELHGQIPQDVADEVYRSTAFQSLGAGTAGAPMSGALTARDLGLTSLNLINQGANLAAAGGNAAQQWANIAGGTMMNPQNMMVSPMERAQWDLQQQLLKYQQQQNAANVAARPNSTLSGLLGLALNVGGMYAGAGGGLGGAMGMIGGGSQSAAPGGGNPAGGSGGGLGAQFMANSAAGYAPVAGLMGGVAGGMGGPSGMAGGMMGGQMGYGGIPVNFGNTILPENLGSIGIGGPYTGPDLGTSQGVDYSSLMAQNYDFSQMGMQGMPGGYYG